MKKKTFKKKYSVKKTIVAVAASVSVFASCFSFLPAYVHAEPEKTLTEEEQKKLEEKKKQEEEVKKQQEQTQKDLQEKNKEVGALEKEQSAVQSQIADLNAQISNLMSDIDILEYDIANTEAAIEVAKEELDEATALEAEQYEATKTRIKIMYEQGETNYVDLLVSSSSFSEFLTNAEYIEKVYQYDQKLLSDYQDTKKQVQEMKEELEIEEADLEAQKEDLVTQKAELDSKMSSLRAIAADYDNQISAAKKQAEQYAKLIKQQNAQIKSLQAEEKALTTPTVTTTTPVTTGAEGGTAIMTGTIVSAGPNAKFHGAQYQIDTGVITSARGSDKGKEVALYAIQFLGNPYVHAGRSLITGTDCSGFTSLVYAHFGIKISPGVAYQRTQGRSVTYEEAEPGDVIFYPGHAALYLGNGKIIHASSSATGIKISNANYRSYTNIQRMLP